MVVAIDFSERLQTGPATDPKNFALVSPDGTVLALASAAYTEAGGIYRVTLTTTVSGPFPAGQYGVRFNGANILGLSGTPVTTPTDRLAVLVAGTNSVVTIGPDASGALGIDSTVTPLGAGVPPRGLAGGDFNSDGCYDLVTPGQANGELLFFYGRPEGGFEDPVPLSLPLATSTTPVVPQSLTVADWNADGRPDLIISDAGNTKRILIYLNDGRGGFSPAPDTPIPAGTDRFYGILGVGDFTGDGVLDIAANVGVNAPGTYWGYVGAVAIYAKDPFLGYSQATVLPTGNDNWFPSTAAAGDFNGDGRPDLVVATTGYYVADPGYVYYLSTPTGLGAAQPLDYDGFGAGGVQVGDYNGDGHADIALSYDRYRNSYEVNEGVVVQLALGNGIGEFTTQPYQGLGRRGVSLVASGDLNGDGKLDLFFNASTWPEWGTTEPSVLPLYGNGDGTFRQGALAPLAPGGNTTPGNFILRDVTGDGFLDALFGNTAGGRIGLLTNDTTGVLRTATPSGPTTGTYRPPGYSLEPELLAADLNRDGISDLLRVANGIDILLGDADGGYRRFDTLGSAAPDWVRVGDLTKDGYPDLVLGKTPYGSLAQVWIGRGDGAFQPGPTVTYPAGDAENGRGALADVNRDGNLDLVFTLTTIQGYGTYSPGYAVYFGDGTGRLTYNANTVLSVPGLTDGTYGTAFVWPPHAFDVTGDGIPDVVAGVSDGGSKLRVYPGVGNGTFNSPQSLDRLSGDASTHFTPLDFDHDGVVDLVGFGLPSSRVFLYRGLGGGRFATAGSVDGAWNQSHRPTSLAAGDFNKDGKVDLAVGLSRYYFSAGEWSKAVILLGDGAGNFTAQFFEVGSDMTAVVVSAGDGWVVAGTVTPALPPPPPGAQPLNVLTITGQPVRVVPPSVPGVPQLIAVAVPPAHGTVRIDDNGSPYNPGDDAFVYTPAAGYSGPDTWSYAVGNAGGATAGSVAVTVTPTNTRPTISDVADQQTTAGAPVGPVGFLVGDLETPAAGLTVAASSSNPTLIPGGNIVLGGSGASRTITITPAAGQTGAATITLTVTDAGGLTATDTFVLTVNPTPPNTPPTISDVRDQQTTPGVPVGPLTFLVGDAETATANLVVTATSWNPVLVPDGNIILGGTGATRTVTVTPVTGSISGTATITLTVTDGGGLTATDTFLVTVNPPPANTPPTISDLSDQSTAAGIPVGPLGFTVGDGETPAAGLAVTASSSNPALVPVGNIALGGGGAGRMVTVTPVAGQFGSAAIILTVTDAGGLSATATFVVTVPAAPPLPRTRPGLVGYQQYAVSAGAGGGPRAVLYDPNGTPRLGPPALGSAYAGGVRTAAADFTGDGVADMVVGTGPGGPTLVRVLDGVTGADLFTVAPFEPSFVGGVYVAAGNLTSDGIPELVITPDEGGGPRVQIYSGAGFGKVADFFGIDDPNFRGGARPAVGDFNGDGRGDLVVAAGFGGGPRVAVFDGAALGTTRGKLFNDLFLFEPALRNGAFVAAGDVDADGFADLIAGGGPGGGPRVLIRSGADLVGRNSADPRVLANFFAGNVDNRGGIRVAAKDLDGDAHADLVVGDGTGAGSRVTGYLGKYFAGGGAPEHFGVDAFPGFTGGVFVG
jgi:hypothetical protein